MTEGQERCHDERRQVQNALYDARGKLEHLRTAAQENLAYDWINQEKSALPNGETEASIDRLRSELQRLDEIDEALTREIAGCESRLRMLEIAREEALSAAVVADPKLQALFTELDNAWVRLRSVRVALKSLSDVLSGPLLARAQSEQPLDPSYRHLGEPVVIGWPMVNAWRDAVARLREDADVALPGSDTSDGQGF